MKAMNLIAVGLALLIWLAPHDSPAATVPASTVLMASALSVCVAIFLLLELDQPFSGLIVISSEPMRNVVEHLGR